VSVQARCGACQRELALVQLMQPAAGFRCPFCGLAFASSYATVAPAVLARVLSAHGELVAALSELQDMVDGRLRIERASLTDPVEETLPGTTRSA
jgi:hypothetical protein